MGVKAKLKPEVNQWDPGERVMVANEFFATMSSLEEGDVEMRPDNCRTELDTHANMAVVGTQALIINNTGKTVEVSPYNPVYQSLTVPLVDAALKYESPFDGKVCILLVRNALHVPTMKNNLLPPFMLREAGIQVNDVPKIQVNGATEDDHSIFFKETGFRIPLSLWGVFSYFTTMKPTSEELDQCEDVYDLSPTVWNPHSDAYASNEEAMLDWAGNMTPASSRPVRLVLDDIEEDAVMASTMTISSIEASVIDAIMDAADESKEWDLQRREVEQIPHVSPIFNDAILADLLEKRATEGKFAAAIGATDIGDGGEYVTPDDSSSQSEEEMYINDSDEETETLLQSCLDGQVDLDEVMAAATMSSKPRGGIDADHLSKVWRISPEDAKRTIETSTQHATRNRETALSRNFSTGDRMLRYKRIRTYFFMDTFFATKKVSKSTRGNTCCQLFVTDKGFVYAVPMKTKAEVLQAVKQFAKEIGAPEALICDMSGEQTSQSLRQFCNDIGTTLRALEEGTPWSNKAELYIGLVKESVRKDIRESNSPLVFWDYCTERRVSIHNLTSRDSFKLQGESPYTALTGEQADISKLCQFAWYEWCYYRDQKAPFPMNKEVLGRVLGPARGEGNEMAQYVLKANGYVIPRRSLRPLTVAEKHSSTEEKKRELFDSLIKKRYGTGFEPMMEKHRIKHEEPNSEEYEDSEETQRIIPHVEDMVDSSGRLLNQQPAYDVLLNAEVFMQHGDEKALGKVMRRALGPDGKTTGTYDPNPYLNSVIYEVELPDGAIKEVSANLIAENILSQVDDDGFSTRLLDAVIDYRKDSSLAVSQADQHVYTQSGQRRMRKTTVGWDLLVKWKDGSEAWLALKDLKESNPVEVAEFAKARGIDGEPAFKWWVPYTLKKRDAIISAVKTRVRKTTHKYGIEIPASVEHAMRIDRENGNTMWQDAVSKEMRNVGIAFEILDEGQKAPIGWHAVTGHLIWDVKMDFTRKARWVLDGHKTADPLISTYAGVVSRESIRITFTYAALNGLDVCAADIRNAYLQAPSSRKDYITCGPEFGLENVGRVALIHRALYGGKTAGRDFRNHLRSCMKHLSFTSCPADPDVWMRPAKKSDGLAYYEYILLYTDDTLCISENPEKILRKELGKYFTLKEESIGPPSIYLGGRVRKVTLDNGVGAWAFGSSQYIQNAVKNVESYIAKPENGQRKLPKRVETPTRTAYRPEIDITPELGAKDATYYQSLIGILRWIVELGRADICLEVSLMSSHLTMPREGHLEEVLRIFGYLKSHHNAEMVFDPSDPVIDETLFERRDWSTSEFGHLDEKEVLPSNMPEPRGMGFTMRAKVDADHATDTVSRRSRTGFIVYLNCAPVYWFAKKQTSVESSSFGSEFIAMKVCCEYLRGLRYKLRMMGIPCEGPVYVFGDNQSVLANTTIPESTLKKKSQSIAYHFVREGVTRDEWRTAYVNTNENEADLLTKQLPAGEKRKKFVGRILHHVYEREGVE